MKKRKRERRLEQALLAYENPLMDALKNEWERMEHAAQGAKRRDDLYRLAGESTAMMGRTILALAAVGGVLAIAVVAPNIFAGIGRTKPYRRFFDRGQFSKAAKNLSQQGLVHIKKGKDGYAVQLTEKGRKRIPVISYAHLAVQKQKSWDGLWRLVLFDIPNKHRWARECFRAKLKDMKFFQLQKSVFVTPYPCEKEISFLAGLFHVASGVRVVEARTIGDDVRLRAHFAI
ncbi:MAG: hypothetical protein AAB916_00880 [Patescibacteria group bacterium]